MSLLAFFFVPDGYGNKQLSFYVVFSFDRTAVLKTLQPLCDREDVASIDRCSLAVGYSSTKGKKYAVFGSCLFFCADDMCLSTNC